MVFGWRKSKLVLATSLSSPPGIPSLFHRQIPLGEDLQLVLAHVALVTVEVEIDVIGHVHRAGWSTVAR